MAESAMEFTLLDFLPDSYRYAYEIKSFDEYISKENDPLHGFRAVICLNFSDTAELEKWRNEFEKKTNTIYTRRNATSDGTIYTLKWILNCHRNTRGQQTVHNSKNTRCPSRLIIKMKRRYPGEDFHVTTIEIDFVHNHSINNEDVSRIRRPTPKLVEKFKKLYSYGHTPTSALHAHLLDLMLEYPDDFESMLNDRSLNPDQRWAHYIKYTFQKEFGKDCVNEREALKLMAEELSREGGRMEILVEKDDDTAIVIVTPLMARVLTTDSANEVLFIDSSRTVDKTKIKVYLLLTHNLIGELPVGSVITSSDSESLILNAFLCLQRLLPRDCFGDKGPSVIVTDDKNIEHNILRVVWPNSTYLLCTFRVLESLWRWLWDSKQNIPQDARLHLMKLVKKVAFSESESEMEENYVLLRTDFVAMQFSAFFQQITNLYERRHLWMFCYKNEKYRRNSHNSAQSAVKIVKDLVFGRTKTFSLVQLADFIIKRLELHFIKRLEAAAFNKSEGGFRVKLSYLSLNSAGEINEKLENDVYKVTNPKTSDSSYVVDTKLGLCSCPGNNMSGACKHLYNVVQYQNIGLDNTLQVTNIEQQAQLYWLSTGKSLPGEFVIVADEPGHMPAAETIYMVEILDQTNEIDTHLLTREMVGNVNLNIEAAVAALQSDNDLRMANIENTNALEQHEEKVERQFENSHILSEIFDDLKKKEKEKPEIYTPALKEFHASYMELTTDEMITSALNLFGKPIKSKQCRARKQPALLAKRQATVSEENEGPRVITVECPQVSANAVAEHCYSRQNLS